jgi:tRNA threonylcarbamoyladenosine biosynthesis protein TsaE
LATVSDIITDSPEATEADAELWGRRVPVRTVVGLVGDYGAGKTAWVRGFARGAGFAGRVRSPSFGLANLYRAVRFPIWHLDLYRLDGAEAVSGAGLDDYILQPEGVTLVEWWDRWASPENSTVHPPSFLLVTVASIGETRRHLRYEVVGF